MLRSARSKPWMWIWFVTDIVSLGHWDCYLQMRGRASSSMLCHQTSYPLPMVKGRTISPKHGASSSAAVASEGRGQWRVVLTQQGSLISTHMVLMASCGNMRCRDQHRPNLQQDHGPRQVPQRHLRPICHHGPGSNTVHPDEYGPSGNMSVPVGYQHGPTWQPRVKISVQPSVVTGATDNNTDPGCSWGIDPVRALGCSSGLVTMRWQGRSLWSIWPLLQLDPQIPTWGQPQVSDQTPGICMVFSGNRPSWH